MVRKKRIHKPPRKQKKHQRKATAKPEANVEKNHLSENSVAQVDSLQQTQQQLPQQKKSKASAKKKSASKPLSSWQQVEQYLLLMRLDKPIGILLLLWPTYWGLWLAAEGMPSINNLIIFTLGCVLMRSAGCVINDYADRHVDGHVSRTNNRPIVSGKVSARAALLLFVFLCALAFCLVLLTNRLTIMLSAGGLLLAFCYPFCKRYTHMPQIVLGAAFAWSIPMAFAAETGELDSRIWLVYLAVVLWAVVYDTFYAMVDRDDDLKIGVKSTAILFGEADKVITGVLQVMVLLALLLAGQRFELGWYYHSGLAVAAGLFVYQQHLIKDRKKDRCFQAFLNNNWVGLVVFVGLLLEYAYKTVV